MKDNQQIFKISEILSGNPGPRYRKDGKNSGEEFRETYLVPWLKENEDAQKLVIEMDGVLGYPPSFLEEAFGGAVREGFSNVLDRIEFRYKNEYKIALLKKYIDFAKKKK